MFKVGFILNGNNHRKKKFYKELSKVRKTLKDVEFNVIETTAQGHATSLAFEFVNEGYTHIIGVGGDGTLNEVINGIMRHENPEVVLGILPFGTANDFVKSIKLPASMKDMFEAVIREKSSKIDIGVIDLESRRHYFLNIADIGIGAEVVKRVNKSTKLFGSNFTFFAAIARTFLTYKNQDVKCHTNDWDYEGKTNSLVMANGKYFGSGMCIAPRADMQDGQFSVVISGDISIKDYLKNIKKIKRGEELSHPKVEYKTASKLELSSTESCGIEADGEFIGYMPASISVVPKKINLLTA
ncbi:diacylglycerol/lipid kinase family protein [Fulvivirga lutimaris]|uniref:diacylglycerol/lipid kinase family protein n=1 Tax=Fulvivirga lutimaris TaxID=1819566 RepID=UPI0012BD1E93|nr:diacylglycerol kinase family protein [Fulvivirga lutimaris]MTI41108.1 diacylglycerol kinase family lipid kinase [Fulvivirga lutimaris]